MEDFIFILFNYLNILRELYVSIQQVKQKHLGV